MHKNKGAHIVLPPSLAVLYIVLDQKEDLGSIKKRSHPDLMKHEFYNLDIDLSDDLSDLLLPRADHWWDDLGKL